jgi:hypothetical protein
MPRPRLDFARHTVPVLDLASYARHGPGRRDRLSPAHIALIARTVRGVPEVMIKMLNQGGNSLGAVAGISATSIEAASS